MSPVMPIHDPGDTQKTRRQHGACDLCAPTRRQGQRQERAQEQDDSSKQQRGIDSSKMEGQDGHLRLTSNLHSHAMAVACIPPNLGYHRLTWAPPLTTVSSYTCGGCPVLITEPS